MAGMDVLIRGAKVVDGTGNPWFYGDVALAGDKVAAVVPRGRIDPANAAEVVDATGHVVSPGFIDIQSHSIMPLFADGRLLSKAHQGVTTEFMGEGWSPAPFGGRIKDPLRSSLVAAGVTFERFPGMDQDDDGIWRPTPDGVGIAWFRDPDGNRLSLTQSG